MEAPDGQIAEALLFFVKTSASTVGFPLLSKICLALTFKILLTNFLLNCQYLITALANLLNYLMESYLDHQMGHYQGLDVFL